MSETELLEVNARFEELQALEAEFEDAELEIIRKADAIHAPLYKKRAEFISRIPHFWSLVFEQAPPEIDNFILPTDSQIFAECLDTFEVSRFELNDPKGSPRSFSLKLGFKENKYFEDKVLEKKFWFRKSKAWEGLVSEPVLIRWKMDQDATGGLTDAAYKLGEAKKKLGIDSADESSRKKETTLPEYKSMVTLIETSQEASVSFFGLFAFVSGYRWISAEESEKFTKEENEKIEKIQRGEKIEDETDEEPEETQDFQEVEVFPGGDEVATIIAEDVWPNALKYYKAAHEEDGEEDDEELSELEVSETELMDEDESDGEVDIRALVGKGRNDQQPPAKKQRKK